MYDPGGDVEYNFDCPNDYKCTQKRNFNRHTYNNLDCDNSGKKQFGLLRYKKKMKVHTTASDNRQKDNQFFQFDFGLLGFKDCGFGIALPVLLRVLLQWYCSMIVAFFDIAQHWQSYYCSIV